VGETGDPAWLERSLLALSTVETFADRSVRVLQKLMFPDSLKELADAEQEASMNSAQQDLYTKGPLYRARRQAAAAGAIARSFGSECICAATLHSCIAQLQILLLQRHSGHNVCILPGQLWVIVGHVCASEVPCERQIGLCRRAGLSWSQQTGWKPVATGGGDWGGQV
jgi:hypothetical protein